MAETISWQFGSVRFVCGVSFTIVTLSGKTNKCSLLLLVGNIPHMNRYALSNNNMGILSVAADSCMPIIDRVFLLLPAFISQL